MTEIVTIVAQGQASAATALRGRITLALEAGDGHAVVHLVATDVRGEQSMDLFGSALEDVSGGDARLAIAAAHPAVRAELDRWLVDGVEVHPTLSAAVAALERTGRRAPARAGETLVASGSASPQRGELSGSPLPAFSQ